MRLACFFSKRTTAYALRISDLSADGCPSDLFGGARAPVVQERLAWRHPVLELAAVGPVRRGVGGQAGPMGRAVQPRIFRIVDEIGRASCRDRECQYVSISVVAVSLKKKIPRLTINNT